MSEHTHPSLSLSLPLSPSLSLSLSLSLLPLTSRRSEKCTTSTGMLAVAASKAGPTWYGLEGELHMMMKSAGILEYTSYSLQMSVLSSTDRAHISLFRA